MSTTTANLLYLFTIVRSSSRCAPLPPRHARHGEKIAAGGMLLAVVVTLSLEQVVTGYWGMAAGMAIGSAIGSSARAKVKMTAMPQMVALFNGVGGGAAVLVALVEFHTVWARSGDVGVERGVSIVFSALVGSISFAGSLIAFGKLQDLISGRPITYPGQQVGNALLLRRLDRARCRGHGDGQLLAARGGDPVAACSASCSCSRSAARTCRS